MSRIRAVGFDLDDTLFDNRGSARAGVIELFRWLGTEATQADQDAWAAAALVHYERWRSGQISFQEQRRERLRDILPPLGVRVPDETEQIDHIFDVYREGYRAAWQPIDGSAELLRELRDAGYRIGILTNGPQGQQIAKLHGIGLFDAVDAICTSEGIGHPKPEPEAFRILAAELGVAPEECLFVGDNAEHDVAGARAAGMRAPLVDHVEQSADDVLRAVRAALHAD